MGGVKTDLLRKGSRWLRRILNPPLHKPEIYAEYLFLGSEYGGSPVLRDRLTADSSVYSSGVGDDISFDLGMIETFGCTVKAFDPTPRCMEWLRRTNTPAQFEFHSIGLSDRTQVMRFSAPPQSDHVSYSVGERIHETDTVELPVKALDELMADIGDKGHEIDLLKMDIEGSEYDALPDMLAKGILPHQLNVEFHHEMFGYSNEQTNEMVEAVRRAGYKLFFVFSFGREYGFYR